MPVIASLNGTTPGGWLDYAQADRAGRRRRARAQRLLPRDRPAGDGRRASSAARSRSCRRSSEAVTHPGGGQALALLHRRSPTSPSSSTRRAPTASCSSTASTSPTSTSRSCEVAPQPAPLRLRRAAAPPALARDPLAASVKALARRHRRRAHRARRVKAIMAGAHAVQMVSALLQRGPALPRDAPRRSSRSGWRSTSTTRSRQMQGSMNLEACPDPQAFERANYMLILQSWRDSHTRNRRLRSVAARRLPIRPLSCRQPGSPEHCAIPRRPVVGRSAEGSAVSAPATGGSLAGPEHPWDVAPSGVDTAPARRPSTRTPSPKPPWVASCETMAGGCRS